MASPSVAEKRQDDTDLVSCVVSGSFKKFKPEIDQTIDRLQGSGATVLAPDKGWLYIPHQRILTPRDLEFRPLPSEVGMSAAQVELEFLNDLVRSDFVYVVNLGGYVGTSVALEMGVAMGKRIPIYCSENLLPDPDLNPSWLTVVKYVKVATPEQAIQEAKDNKRFMQELGEALISRFPALAISRLAYPEMFQRLLRLAARVY